MVQGDFVAKKRLGRPKKTADEKLAPPTPLRLDAVTLAGVDAYQKRQGFAMRSEAMRQLIRRGLREEGLI